MRRYRLTIIAVLALALMPPLILPLTIYGDGFMKGSGYHAPALASNSMDNTSLLVFTEVDIWGRASIKGMLVDAYGNPLEPKLAISDSMSRAPYDARPSVAWDADSGRYLVAWHDGRTGWQNVWAQLVGMDGLMIGANFGVSQCECDQLFPVTANSPHEGLFLVAWEDYRPGEFNLAESPTPDIWGALLDATGSPITNGPSENMPLYIAPGEQANISIASDGADTFMLAFEDHEYGRTAITGQMLWAFDASTVSAPDEGCAVSGWHEAGGVGSPSVAPNPSEGFIVYWSDGRDEGAIHAQAIDYNCMDTGSSFEENVSIGANLAQAEWPAAALGTNPGRHMVTWQERSAKGYDIVAAFLSPLGLDEGPLSVRMVSEEPIDEINAAVAHNPLVPNYLIAYESTNHASVYDILIASLTDPAYPDIDVTDPAYPYDDMFLDFSPAMAAVAAHRTITIGNESPMAGLNVSSLTTEGPFAIVAETCTMMPIAPESSCTVSLEFLADDTGAYEGALIVRSDDPDEGETYVDLYAETTMPIIFLPEGDTTDFGAVPVGETAERQIPIRNMGTYPLLIKDAGINGSPEMSISWDTCSGRSLLPMSSCYIAVSYAPQGEGQSLASITMPTSDPEADMIVFEAKGHGATPEIEGASYDNAVNLGVHTGGSGYFTKHIYLHNTGLAPLYVEDIWAEGSPSIGIIEDQCSGYETAPKGSCFFILAYAPSETGQDAATVRVATNDPDAATAEFTAYGASVSIDVPDIRIEASSLDLATRVAELGMVYPGYSISQIVTLHNDGTGPLELGSARIEGEGFHIAKDACSHASVQAGSYCQMSVIFNPLEAGEFRGALSVPSNDPDESLGSMAFRASGQATETAPTAPVLIAPSDGQNVQGNSVELTWSPSFDLDGNDITYEVLLSTAPDFANPAMLPVDMAAAMPMGEKASASAALMLLMGAAVAGASRKRFALVIAALMLGSALLAACGDSGGSVIAIKAAESPSDAQMSYTLRSLSADTTYYWKVTATDSTGLSSQSEPRSFRTSP